MTFDYAIKHDKRVCNSFIKHKNPQQITAQMLDKNNDLKPFYKFYRDVEPLIANYDNDLLEKEYSMAVGRAHLAVNWHQFKQEKDILPNLRWIKPVNSNGCKNHEKYWNRIWKINDPFWEKHYPADCLDCQCELIATDEPITD
jgi:hypothetical protein